MLSREAQPPLELGSMGKEPVSCILDVGLSRHQRKQFQGEAHTHGAGGWRELMPRTCHTSLGSKPGISFLIWSLSSPGFGCPNDHACTDQSCLTLCDPKDYSPPGSSVHGILQARILEWVAMPSSRGSSPSRD